MNAGIKLFISSIILLCFVHLNAGESSSGTNKDQNPENSKKEMVFDSCGKDNSGKCSRKSSLPFKKNSKSLQ